MNNHNIWLNSLTPLRGIELRRFKYYSCETYSQAKLCRSRNSVFSCIVSDNHGILFSTYVKMLLSWSHLKHDTRRTPLSSVDCPVDCMLGRIDLRSRMGEWIRISRLWPVSLGVQFQLELFNFLHERAHCWRLFLSESRQSSFNASVLCQKVICRFWMKYVDDPGNVMISWYIHKTRGSSLSLFLLFFLPLSASFSSLSVMYHEAMFYP